MKKLKIVTIYDDGIQAISINDIDNEELEKFKPVFKKISKLKDKMDKWSQTIYDTFGEDMWEDFINLMPSTPDNFEIDIIESIEVYEEINLVELL